MHWANSYDRVGSPQKWKENWLRKLDKVNIMRKPKMESCFFFYRGGGGEGKVLHFVFDVFLIFFSKSMFSTRCALGGGADSAQRWDGNCNTQRLYFARIRACEVHESDQNNERVQDQLHDTRGAKTVVYKYSRVSDRKLYRQLFSHINQKYFFMNPRTSKKNET